MPAKFNLTRTRSPRWLAGTRANKRHPIARATRPSGTRTRVDIGEEWAGAWWRNTATLPQHADRAVDIGACFGPRPGEREPSKESVLAGNAGTSAAPMTLEQRVQRYSGSDDHPGNWVPTDRQARRIRHKARRAGEIE